MNKNNYGKMKSVKVEKPSEQLFIDFCGPFPISDDMNTSW